MHPCLSHDDVADYVRGVASGSRMTQIVRHVERCEICRRCVAALVRAGRACRTDGAAGVLGARTR